jgi:exonuclease SbcD
MKILHTADWHLGKWLDNYPRLPEQKEILEEICEIAEHELVDVVLIAGDLFDTFNPSAEAQELFYKTLRRLGNNGKRAVVAIAGNHD